MHDETRIGLGAQPRDEVGVDFDGEEPRLFGQRVEERPRRAANAGAKLHYHLGLAGGDEPGEPPRQEAGAGDDRRDEARVPHEPQKKGDSIIPPEGVAPRVRALAHPVLSCCYSIDVSQPPAIPPAGANRLPVTALSGTGFRTGNPGRLRRKTRGAAHFLNCERAFSTASRILAHASSVPRTRSCQASPEDAWTCRICSRAWSRWRRNAASCFS